MAKKRGGLAGIWDRNKKIIKPVATGLAGIVGTPALGAAVGAAMGGLDRPGKSGIGVDLGGALKGGISGYGAGLAGNALKQGVIGGLAEGSLGSGLRQGIGSLPGMGALATPGSALSKIPQIATGLVTGQGSGGGNGLPGLGTLGIPGLGGGDGGGSGVDPWMKALAAAQVANAAALGKKSGDFADKSWNLANDWWNQRAPLREKGIAGMQAAPTELPQLGKIGAVGNPFAQG